MLNINWQKKLLEDKGLPRVEPIEGKKSTKWGTGTVLLPAPKEVDEIMKLVPKGKLITVTEIRCKLAERHKATIGCPITTGIGTYIAARAADEAEREGKKTITPYWRTLKAGGIVNEKYPGGIERQRELLENEGHRIIQKGKKFLVAEYEEKLIAL